MEFNKILKLNKFKLDRDNVWKTDSSRLIYYPEEASNLCFEVEDASFWFNQRNEIIFSVLSNFIDKDEFFWDIGGGNGFVCKYLEARGFNTILVEPGIKACFNASRRGLTRILNSTIEQIWLDDDKIQSCGLFDVLEHIPDDRKYLKSIANLLADNGRVVLTVPAYSLLWSTSDKIAKHFRRYNMKSLRKTAEEACLFIDWATYFFSYLILPIVLFRVIPAWLGVNKYRNIASEKGSLCPRRGVTTKLFEKLNLWENSRIIREKKVFAGSSIIAVLRKG